MDNSLNDSTASITQCSPPKRRRSTFFEKRESLVPQNHQEITSNDEDNGEKENAKYEDELIQYLEKLTQEKEKWKTELNKRKSKYRELKLQLKLTAWNTQKKYDYSLLSDEDIQYLKNKPNYANISENTLELNRKVKESLKMCEQLKKLENYLIDFCEYRLNSLQSHIINNSSLGELSD